MINLIFISDLLHSTENQNKFKTDFLDSSKEIDMKVKLKSDISDRIGHPVLNLKYWGDTYLCDNQWSHSEAKVMCRELGFESGAKFYKKQTSKDHKITYANYVGKFNCDGDEDKLTECDRTVLEESCDQSQELSLLLCDVGGFDGVHKNTKVRGYPFIFGAKSDQYFCNENFGNLEASVFCKMLGWNFGRSLFSNNEYMKREGFSNIKCAGLCLQLF